MSIQSKVCTKCGEDKLLSEYHKNKTTKDGYVQWCKKCRKERLNEIKTNKKMMINEQIRSSIILENKLLKKDNKKLCSMCGNIFLISELKSGNRCCNCQKEYNKEYTSDNKEKINKMAKEYRDNNKDKRKEYRENNKDKSKDYKKKYREKNKEAINKRAREYRGKMKAKKLLNDSTSTHPQNY